MFNAVGDLCVLRRTGGSHSSAPSHGVTAFVPQPSASFAESFRWEKIPRSPRVTVQPSPSTHCPPGDKAGRHSFAPCGTRRDMRWLDEEGFPSSSHANPGIYPARSSQASHGPPRFGRRGKELLNPLKEDLKIHGSRDGFLLLIIQLSYS